jgi:hypothetical protein
MDTRKDFPLELPPLVFNLINDEKQTGWFFIAYHVVVKLR